MKVLLAFSLLILTAFLGSRFLFKGKRFFSPLGYFFLSGLIYIFLGLFLGKRGIDVLSPQVLEDLNPLVSLGLGWVGFLFGFQLESKYLRRFPQRYIALSFLQSVFVFILVTAALILLLNWLFPSESLSLLLGMALALGLLASLNSPSLLNFASSGIPKRGQYYYLARFLASVSGFWGIAGLALLVSFWHFPFFKHQVFLKGLILLFSSTILAFLLGYVFHILTKKKIPEHDLLVYLFGLVFFASGIAFYFNLPSLYVSMVLGITFSNLTRIQEKIYPLLLSTEKPFYIIFLVLIGALWEFSFDLKIVALVVLLFLLRVIGYALPLRSLGGMLHFSFPLPSLFGLCFLSPGGLALAFAISLKLTHPVPMIDIFVSVALLGTIASEFVSPWALKKSLFKLDSEE